MLRIMYEKQEATVTAGGSSRKFALERGVKQGDPISALLFIAVMEAVFRVLKAKWGQLNNRRSGSYYGLVIDDPLDPLTNLRFADDILLVAASRGDIKKMIADLSNEASKYGLKVHMGKTKVLTNTALPRPTSIKCADNLVGVLAPEESERYLGRKLSISDYHTTEMKNRLASGWAAFFKFKVPLCNRKLCFKDRIKLFDSVVTPCVLYGCGAWTLTVADEQKLTTTRRRMIRWMVCTPRDSEESWVEYIRRATHICEQLVEKHGSCNWVRLQKTRKWKLAGKTASCIDGRWATRLLTWKPWFRTCARRRVGRPLKRWDDDIVALAGGDWPEVARDRLLWDALKEGYILQLGRT